MLTGETKTGFKYAVDEAALNDWELLEDLDGIENNPQRYVRLETEFFFSALSNKMNLR